MSDIENSIDFVCIELIGSEYRTEMEDEIRDALDTVPYKTIVRGRHSVAAGVGLSHDITIFVAGAIASGLLYDLLKLVLSRILGVFAILGEDDVPLKKVTFKMQECDFIISANCNADTYSELIDYNHLLAQMETFANNELKHNSPVMSIEAPCDLRLTACGWECECYGIGNYSLWRVEYKSGDRWPEAIYDAVNESYIELLCDESIALPADLFYANSRSQAAK